MFSFCEAIENGIRRTWAQSCRPGLFVHSSPTPCTQSNGAFWISSTCSWWSSGAAKGISSATQDPRALKLVRRKKEFFSFCSTWKILFVVRFSAFETYSWGEKMWKRIVWDPYRGNSPGNSKHSLFNKFSSGCTNEKFNTPKDLVGISFHLSQRCILLVNLSIWWKHPLEDGMKAVGVYLLLLSTVIRDTLGQLRNPFFFIKEN